MQKGTRARQATVLLQTHAEVSVFRERFVAMKQSQNVTFVSGEGQNVQATGQRSRSFFTSLMNKLIGQRSLKKMNRDTNMRITVQRVQQRQKVLKRT
jgi:ABC-type uncharacterized transport system ATPase subunit